MKFEKKTINEKGLQQIHDFLGEYHKKGYEHFNREMLQAWAADAEFQLSEGNPASIELKSWECITGATKEFTISSDGIDIEIVEIED